MRRVQDSSSNTQGVAWRFYWGLANTTCLLGHLLHPLAKCYLGKTEEKLRNRKMTVGRATTDSIPRPPGLPGQPCQTDRVMGLVQCFNTCRTRNILGVALRSTKRDCVVGPRHDSHL